MSESFDVIVLGGGTGGYVAAIRASQLGLKVAVVEKEKVGGTCLHQGCIPSKALLKSAEMLQLAGRLEEYGVQGSVSGFSLAAAMNRKTAIVDQLYKGVSGLLKKHHVQVISGFGRVMGPSIFSPRAGAIRVEQPDGESQIFNPSHVIIATGSRPRSLKGLPFDGEYVLNSNHALRLTEVPKSIIIVGGGAIGCEWASMLNDFGSEVTLVESMPQLLPAEDADVAQELVRHFAGRKVNVLTNAQVITESYGVNNGLVSIQVEREGRTETLTAEKLLVSVGREAVVDEIGLDATEIKLDKGYIHVDASMRTNEPNIFAIGDVIGGLQLAHVASLEGIVAAEAIAGLAPREIRYEQVPRCTYTRPEVASVGITEQEARERGHEVKTGKFSFRANGKALVNGDPEGFVKIVSDVQTGDLLGVHLIGAHATDLISEAALAQVLNATAWEIGQTIHPHPTLSEVIGEAALAVEGRAIHS